MTEVNQGQPDDNTGITQDSVRACVCVCVHVCVCIVEVLVKLTELLHPGTMLLQRLW